MSKRKEFKNRKHILAKVNNCCEVCGRDNNLHIHHRDFDNSNNSLSNAQVVYGDCHTELHRVANEAKWEQHVAEVRRKDLETERKMKDAWVKSGRLLNGIGREESAEFFSNYLLEGKE